MRPGVGLSWGYQEHCSNPAYLYSSSTAQTSPSLSAWKNNINQLEIKILPCPGEISIIPLNWSRVTSNDIICFMFLWSWATRRWEDSATSRSNASAPLADATVLFRSLLLSDYWVLYFLGCQDMHVPTSKVGPRMTRNPSIKRISKGNQLQVVTRNWLNSKNWPLQEVQLRRQAPRGPWDDGRKNVVFLASKWLKPNDQMFV